MDQTFFVFLVLFGILIIYLFKQKSEKDKNKASMMDELVKFVKQENFENASQNESGDNILENDTSEDNEINLINESGEYREPIISAPEPSNQPNTPTPNGFSTTLIFNHPDKIHGCDITNIAPMDYYKEINQKINQKNEEKVMNGGDFGDVTGYADEDDGYYGLDAN